MSLHIRTVVLACAVGIAIPSHFTPVQADVGPFDQRSHMTFSQPVTFPGVTLPPGEYIFRLPDRGGARMVLQVLSSDGKQVHGMFQTRPTTRDEATDDPAVTFHESGAGGAPPVRAWFYAGQRFGLEFAYPRSRPGILRSTRISRY